MIVRKEGSAPEDVNDGELVYESYGSNYVDVDGEPGTHYFYRIFTVSHQGKYSEGIVLDYTQPFF